ncbi:hypothetical protein JAAARDRAFT_576056 [Jaapia argillacea MUCL 33604]|uniref:Uncharacterized protein n=1 Tax=Jaapia argillacea MUCL 33604 TaxID=933084 RepID=A0A067QF45_9AGAM|nr:hypothetical protein JAAARDRAFT_576056 [Jaapia argillacea MUCL 33604]
MDASRSSIGHRGLPGQGRISRLSKSQNRFGQHHLCQVTPVSTFTRKEVFMVGSPCAPIFLFTVTLPASLSQQYRDERIHVQYNYNPR